MYGMTTEQSTHFLLRLKLGVAFLRETPKNNLTCAFKIETTYQGYHIVCFHSHLLGPRLLRIGWLKSYFIVENFGASEKRSRVLMALAFTNLSWWLWSGKQKEPRISNGTCLNSSPELGSDALKINPVKGAKLAASSSRKVKQKWHRRKEGRIDRDYDAVLVPSDGEYLSSSESDDSDWSIGWSEPHGPGFQSGDEADDSFAVLVPCYGHAIHGIMVKSKNNDQNSIGMSNIPDGYSDESKKHMEEWLSSLRNI